MKTVLYVYCGLAILGLLVFTLKASGISVVYQGSDSMRKGLYLILPLHHFKQGDNVLFTPPPQIVAFLKQQPWAPTNAHLLKKIVAMPGDLTCKQSNAIWINHHRFAPVYLDYAPHRRLPNYPFCETLKPEHYLLMSQTTDRFANQNDSMWPLPVQR